MDEALLVYKCKAYNDHGGKRKIVKKLAERGQNISETRAGFLLLKFFYDLEDQVLFVRSCEARMPHRRCISEEELVSLVKSEHSKDHCGADSCYESIWADYNRTI